MSMLKELLAAARSRSAARDHERAAQVRVDAVAAELKLNPTRRSGNLRLLRTYMNADQQDFVSMLGIGSQSFYSRIERGDSQLDDRQARKIESEIDLSPGWLDRDNGQGMLVSNSEWQLIQELRNAAPEATFSLIETAKSFRACRSART